MPSFCDPNDKPVIYYKFGDSAYRKIQLGAAPIEIIIEPLDPGGSKRIDFTTYTPGDNYGLPVDNSFLIEANPQRTRIQWIYFPQFLYWNNSIPDADGYYQGFAFERGSSLTGNPAKGRLEVGVATYGEYPTYVEYQEFFN